MKKRIFSIAVLIVVFAVFISVLCIPAGAVKYVNCNLWSDGKASLPTGISGSGSTYTLNGYNSGSLAFFPAGEPAWDEEIPDLNLYVLGNNTISYGYFARYQTAGTDSSPSALGSLYSSRWLGGIYAAGSINIYGTGTLNIGYIAPDSGAPCPVEMISSDDGTVNIYGDVKVNIICNTKKSSYSGTGISTHTEVKGNAVLGMHVYSSTGTDAGADIVGVANGLVLNGNAYADINTYGANKASVNYCEYNYGTKTSTVTLNGNSCAYFRNRAGMDVPAVTGTGLKKYDATDAKIHYCDYINESNTHLKDVDCKELADYINIPGLGISRYVSNTFDASPNTVYLRRNDEVLSLGIGGPHSAFSNYQADKWYSLGIEIIPQPGYKMGSSFTESNMRGKKDPAPSNVSVSDVSSASSVAKLNYAYYYFTPEITKQPVTLICAEDRTDIETLEINKITNATYQWYMDFITAEGETYTTKAEGFGFNVYSGASTSNKLSLDVAKILGTAIMNYGGPHLFREYKDVQVYCVAKSVCSTVRSEPCHIRFSHQYDDYFAYDWGHTRECLDLKCAFREDLSVHEDLNGDSVCDVCHVNLTVIVKQPEKNITVERKDNEVKLSITAQGEDLKYSWYIYDKGSPNEIKESSVKFSGQKTNTLTVKYYLNSSSCNIFDDYEFRCKVTGLGGTVTSDAAKIKLLHSPESGKYASDKDGHWPLCYCGDKLTKEAHKESGWITDTVATVTAPGAKHTECTLCKEKMQTAVIPQLTEECKHEKTTVTGGKKATCTEAGSTGVSACDKCGATVKTDTVIPALGHDYVNHEAKAPTEKEVGWEAYKTCSRCDYTTYKEIPATGKPDPDKTYTIGDVDNNGIVDVNDARLALRAAVKLEDEGYDFKNKESREFKAADADKNGEIKVDDARKILRVAVKLETF